MTLRAGVARLILKLLGWKSGFCRIALAARMPVLVATIDWSRHEIGILAELHPGGDAAADMARITACYQGRRGYHQHNASPIRLP